jgi:hypothetical protein
MAYATGYGSIQFQSRHAGMFKDDKNITTGTCYRRKQEAESCYAAANEKPAHPATRMLTLQTRHVVEEPLLVVLTITYCLYTIASFSSSSEPGAKAWKFHDELCSASVSIERTQTTDGRSSETNGN